MNKFDKTLIKRTQEYTTDKGDVFVVRYGTHKIGEQIAYVTVTVDGWYKNRRVRREDNIDFGGCCHDLVLKHAPELKPLVELHLTDVDGEPMHYIANAKYWWELATHTSRWSSVEKRSSKECAEIFRKHVLCGVKLPCDKFMPQPESMMGWEKSGIEEFLNGRREQLRAYTEQVLEKFLSNDETVGPGEASRAPTVRL